uniref:Uncharacterized protein n=1 Tax=Capra hircus TaxID=9925 RepID=A0A452EJR6_CAPHI
GCRNIVAAMKTHGADKVMGCTSAFLPWDPSKDVTDDQIQMQKILQESGMPQPMGDQPLTGAHTGTLDGRGPSRVISKQDLGHFMLPSLTTGEYKGHSTYPSHEGSDPIGL